MMESCKSDYDKTVRVHVKSFHFMDEMHNTSRHQLTDRSCMFIPQNVKRKTQPQQDVIDDTEKCLTDNVNDGTEILPDTMVKDVTDDMPQMSGSSSTAVDWETVHQSYVKKQIVHCSNNDRDGENSDANVEFSENDYFGSQSSVFKLHEDNTHFGETVKLTDSSSLSENLTEAGFDEDNTADLPNTIPHNDIMHGNSNFSHQVRPIKLEKEIQNQNVQKSVIESGSDITLLDMSSINQLKKMWSKSGTCPNKLKKVNPSHTALPVSPKPVQKQKCQKYRKQKAIKKTKSKVGCDKATHINSEKLTVKMKSLQGKCHSGMKFYAIKKSSNSPITMLTDKLSAHTKPCSVNLTRISETNLTRIPNLKVDLTIPNVVSEKSVKTSQCEKVIRKKYKKVDVCNDNVGKQKVIKSNLKVHVNKLKMSTNRFVSEKAGDVNEQMNLLDQTVDQENEITVNDRKTRKAHVLYKEDDDECSLGNFELEEAGDCGDYFLSEDEGTSSSDLIDKFVKQKSRKLVKFKRNCDKDYKPKSFNPVTKVKNMNYPNKGTGRIGAPPKKGHFECKHCDFVADELNLVEKHHISIHRQNWKSCKYCEFRSRSEEVLLEHTAKEHTYDKPFKCDFEACEYASNNRTDLSRHKSKHSPIKNFCCELCTFKTKWRRNMRHHKTLVHSTERPFSCSTCGGRFKRKSDLTDHMYRHSDEKLIQCTVCDFRCKTNFELGSHMTRHSDNRPFKCTFPGCDHANKTKSDLTKHMKIHSTTFDHVCPICSKAFKTKMNLRKHHNYMHQTTPGVKPYKCDICQRAYKARNTLSKHLKLHDGIYPFTCNVCNHRFSNKHNLQTHSVVHESDRPFHCPVCPYRYKDPGSLLSHIGYFHGDSYAYFCEICKKPWKRYSQLQIHYKRMHTKKELEYIGSEKAIDLALLKMEMKLELEQAELEHTEKRPRGRPKKKRKQKNGKKNQHCDNVDIKQEPVDDYEPDKMISNVSSCLEQSKTIRDVRLNEATGEIEVVSNEGVVVSDLISTNNVELINGEQQIIDHIHEQQDIDDSGINLNPHDTLKEVTKNSVIDADSSSNLTEASNSDTLMETDDTSNKKVSETADLGMNKTRTDIGQNEMLNTCNDKELHNILQANMNSEDGIKNLVYKKIEKPKATLAVYDDFRLPLATKGFQFNYDKNGKKPKSWFMDPDNMHGNFKGKMEKYLRSVGKLPPLPRGRPPSGPRGPRGPNKKRNVAAAFMEDRKRKLNKCIKRKYEKKNIKFQLNDLNLNDVEQRHSVPRTTRYGGTYSELKDTQLFETVAGEDLSYNEVIERLPLKPTPKVKLVSNGASSKVSQLKQKHISVSKKKTKVKKTASKQSNKLRTNVQRKRKAIESDQSSQRTTKNTPLKKRIKITPVKKCIPLEQLSDIKQVNTTKPACINAKKPYRKQPSRPEDQSFNERNSFETLQHIVSEFLNKPDDSSLSVNSVKERKSTEIAKESKPSKSKISQKRKASVTASIDKGAMASTKGAKRKSSSSNVKAPKQKKTCAKKTTKQFHSKLKVKISKTSSSSHQTLSAGTIQSYGNPLELDLNPKVEVVDMAVDNTIHIPLTHSQVVMVYPPGNVPIVHEGNKDSRQPDERQDSTQSHTFYDINMQNMEIPNTMLGLPQMNSDVIFMPCEANVSNQSPVSQVHPILLTHTPAVVPGYSCNAKVSLLDRCRPDFEENSKFHLSESKEHVADYSGWLGDIDDGDGLTNTSNLSDDRTLMKEEYMVTIKRENSSD